MMIAWMSFPYTSSSVPSSPPGSWWSIARSVVQTCGHLNFGFTALTSNDCWSVEESLGDPVGRNGPAGNKFGLRPGFESTFPIHTNGDRKSTRLNSSHGYISYAVFCLKKKM